ncbi:MAG: HAMP domain-containing protein [Magnetococcales bacterium]|nr:HAMP domain-containing protein [Magnetococcales bacterium]
MRSLLPVSLAGRTQAILFVGLTLSHILSILVFTSEKLEVGVVTSERQVLERMAAITRLLLEIPAALHEPVLAAMNRSGLHVEVQHQAAGGPPPVPVASEEPLRRSLERSIGPGRARVVGVGLAEPDWDHRYGSLHRLLFAVEMGIIRLMHHQVLDRELRAWVELPVGHRIFLTTRPADNHVPLFRHATLSVIIMTVAIFLFALLIARHMTVPLGRIVQAAEAIGQDVHAAPLPETGPTEIVAVARAFNRMNRGHRDFVAERLRLIAAISHDLRTPLTQLKLMVEFAGEAATRQRMAAILDEMASMLTTTLEFARDASAGEARQRVNLGGLVSAICADLGDIGQAVVCAESDRLPCTCRPLAMKRALTNLIHNAVKYGGAARVSLARAGERIAITIHDPGPGIPPSAWDTVFEPFQRLESSGGSDSGGVGLGLSIAASVIRDHGGTIHFAHPPEGGFATRVELPGAPVA